MLAQQLLRIRDGQKSVTPLLEFCGAWPGSTWHSGGGGGLSPGGSVTASITGTVMTVTNTPAGVVIAPGQNLVGAGINAAVMVLSNGTGTGGNGTYNTGINQSSLEVTFTGTSPAATFTGNMNRGILTVDNVISGSLAVNQVISGPANLPAGSIIVALGTGAGGVGTYFLGLAQTVGSESINCQGASWNNMTTVLTQAKASMPYHAASAISWSSIGYTQGGAADGTNAGKVADLTDMMVQFDALSINATPLKIYLSLPCPVSNATTADVSVQGTYTFCRTNAPGQGGTYTGRAYPTGPSYPWQFNGGDNIHTGNYGSSRWGEIEGYARWLVQDKGVAWTPLWRPLTGGTITRAGQVLTVPMARPAGPDFAAGVLSFQSNADDGIKVWPQNGFHVKRSGVDLTVTPSSSGMNVLLAIAETISPGDVLEVSYAWYGPGGTNPGLNSGVGGNLVMQGPASVLYPSGWNGVAKTIDAWAWPFLESITA